MPQPELLTQDESMSTVRGFCVSSAFLAFRVGLFCPFWRSESVTSPTFSSHRFLRATRLSSLSLIPAPNAIDTKQQRNLVSKDRKRDGEGCTRDYFLSNVSLHKVRDIKLRDLTDFGNFGLRKRSENFVKQ